MSGTLTLAQDESINCPITGEVCPSRERAVRMFTGTSDVSYEQSKTLRPYLDGLKLQARLAELTTQANIRGCVGVIRNGDCPVAVEMRESRPRQTVIAGIRGLLRKTNL